MSETPVPPSGLTSNIPSAVRLTASDTVTPSQVELQLLSKSRGPEVSASPSVDGAFKSKPKLDYTRPLQERICFFLDQNLGTDVKFIVGEDEEETEVLGHKIILASASPVFFSMFFSDMVSENEVKIPDCDPESFKALVNFIYRGKIGSLVVCERATELLYIARKYSIRQLEDECCLHLSSSVTSHSVFQTLDIASMYDLPALSLICWDYIQDATQDVLTLNMPILTLPLLLPILRNDHLNIAELTLFQLILQWGNLECERSSVEPNPENMRNVLTGILPLIRFPAMFPHEIADHVVPSGVLSSEQIANIYTFIYATDESKRPNLDFDPHPRLPLVQDIDKKHRPLRYGIPVADQVEPERGRHTSRYASLIMPAPDLSDSPDDNLNEHRNTSRRRNRRSRRNRNRN